MYLEGLGFSSIGCFLNCSHVSVYNWIWSFGERFDPLKKEVGIEIMEINEMYTYILSKKTIAESGLLLIDMEENESTTSLGAGGRKQVKNYGQSPSTGIRQRS